MTIEEVYQYFGSAYAAAKAIGVTKQAFSEWIKHGFIPIKRQEKIEHLTKGKLIARSEDAKKPDINITGESESNYLPNFRYYDKKNGMCKVESIHFRKGNRPKITYVVEGNNKRKFTVFSTRNLMQAADLVDWYNHPVFEGDILQFENNGNKNGEKFIFKSINQINQLKKLINNKLNKNLRFKIIGNIFE